MGGQAKKKSSSKTKRKQRGRIGVYDLSGLSTEERMKVKMKNKAKKKTSEKYTVEQLLEKTEEYLDSFNLEMAQLFCQRALDMEPENLDILDMMGNICMEMGDADKAKEVLLKAVELSPDKGHAKYMCLGQIHSKEEALHYFKKGLQIMLQAYQSQPQVSGAASCPDDMEVTTKDISTALCSVAEIYLTDLCMDQEAGEKCKEAIEKALEYNPNSPEVLQLMASYLFSMEQPQEGKKYLLQSLSPWLPSMQNTEGETLPQETSDTETYESVFPPYESRITTAKLLIEAEEFELAMEILEGLLEEDDEVIQVWYLLGWISYLQAKEAHEEDAFKDSARTYLKKARKLYNKLKCDDSPLLEHVEQILGELGAGEGSQDSDDEAIPLDSVNDDFVESSEDEAMEA